MTLPKPARAVLWAAIAVAGAAAFGGIAKVMPVFAAFFALATLSSVGLPGLNGFVGEFLILLGAFATMPWATAIATSGVILSAVYMLWAMRSATGNTATTIHYADYNRLFDMARGPLDDAGFAAACAAGQLLSIEQALALAERVSVGD